MHTDRNSPVKKYQGLVLRPSCVPEKWAYIKKNIPTVRA